MSGGITANAVNLEFLKETPLLMKKSIRLRTIRINIMESLILAQNERWRRVLSMQVERQV